MTLPANAQVAERGLGHLSMPLLAALLGAAWLVAQDPPVWGDRAYFLIHARLVAGGLPLYESSIYGYTPYGPLLGGFAARLTEPLGIPFLLSQRLAGLGLYLAATALTVVAAERLTGSRRIALLAGVAWVGMAFPMTLSVVAVEPKMIVAVVSLLWLIALDSGRLATAGLLAGVGAMTWQPAGILLLVSPMVLRRDTTPAVAAGIARLLGGFAVGCVPALAYVITFDSWPVMFDQAIVRKATTSGAGLFRDALTWPARAGYDAIEDLPILFAALLGFIHLAVGAGARERRDRLGPLFVSTAAWAVFSTLEFGGIDDLVPFTPQIAILAGLAFAAVVRSFPSRWGAVLASMAIAATLFWDLAPARYATTAAQQTSAMHAIVESVGPDHPMVAFNVDEFYALTGRDPPIRVVRMRRYSYDDMERRLVGGRLEFAASVRRLRPGVVLHRPTRDPELIAFLEEELAPGYIRFEVPGYAWHNTRTWTTRLFPRNGFFRRPLHVYVDPEIVTPAVEEAMSRLRRMFEGTERGVGRGRRPD